MASVKKKHSHGNHSNLRQTSISPVHYRDAFVPLVAGGMNVGIVPVATSDMNILLVDPGKGGSGNGSDCC